MIHQRTYFHDRSEVWRYRRPVVQHCLPILLAMFVAAGIWPRPVIAEPIDGFTEPFRTIDVASPEAGIVTHVHVREGEVVRAGQALVTLDVDVLEAHLAIAERGAQSLGTLESARAEQRLRQERLEKLEQLRVKGIARQEEVDRARADLEIAESGVLSAQDDLAVRRLECDKIRAQIERRTVRAPIDGVVNAIHKELGEYVSTADPHFMTLVQLDPLLAIFSMTTSQAVKMRTGQQVTVQPMRIGQDGTMRSVPAEGVVEFVAPITHAESGTVLVTIRLQNPDGDYRSGERCWLDVANELPASGSP